MGTSVENVDCRGRIDSLRKVKYTVRLLSIEPLIGDAGVLDLSYIDWVIVGCRAASHHVVDGAVQKCGSWPDIIQFVCHRSPNLNRAGVLERPVRISGSNAWRHNVASIVRPAAEPACHAWGAASSVKKRRCHVYEMRSK